MTLSKQNLPSSSKLGTTCPKCNQPMKEVTGWKWCPQCAYREDEEGKQPAFLIPDEKTTNQQGRRGENTNEFFLTFKVVPAWGWVLIFGVLSVAAVSFYADYKLADKPRERAVWSTNQVLGGLLLWWMAGLLVAFRIETSHEPLGLTDVLFPDRLWRLAIRNLPVTRWHVCIGTWAAMAAVCGLFWPGGLTYWLPERSEVQEDKAPLSNKFGNKENEDLGKEPKAKPVPGPKKMVATCFIVGYTTEEGTVTSLYVGRLVHDRLHYGGIVPGPDDPEVNEDLLERFIPHKADAPVFPELKKVRATWLKLRKSLSCEVESEGLDDRKLLKDPVFKRLLPPEKP